MESDALKFNDLQRKQLLALGLIPAQVEVLEARALRAIALYSRPVQLAEARGGLERLHRDASRLLKGMRAMSLEDLPTELDTARRLLLMAFYEREGELPSAEPLSESLLAGLGTFVDTAERALAMSRAIKERNHAASPDPIRFIVRLLQEALPAGYLWQVSITMDWLRELAGICYEASHRENSDPERAVRAFFQQQALSRRNLAERLRLDVSASGAEAQQSVKKTASKARHG